MELDSRALVGYLRRWWWVAVAVPLVTAGLVYAVVSRQTPLYLATATLTVKPASTSGEVQVDPIRGSAIAQTYRELVGTQEVLGPVAARLGGDYTVEHLQDVVTATSPANKFLLKISASDADPRRAVMIANDAAEEFHAYVRQRADAEIGASLAGLDAFIAEQERAVAEAQGRLEEARAQGASELVVTQLTDEVDAARQQLREVQARGEDLRTTGALQQPQVQLAAQAQEPTTPYAPRTVFYAVLGLLLGVALAGGVIVLMAYLDNTVKPQLDFPSLVGAPLMAVVPSAATRFHRGGDQLFMRSRASSTMAESIRLLRANVEFAAATREIGTLAVTSSTPGEGKSTITANLAVGMTQTGFTVAVVDADLRRPNQHRIFGVANTVGLTTLLTREAVDWTSVAHEVGVGLWVVTSGPIPPNPADLLGSDRLRTALDQLTATVDVVLVDTPPLLVVSDPLVVASKTDATLLVSRSGETRIDSLRRAAGLLHQGGVRVIGVALNLESGRGPHGYSYSYDGDYYSAEDQMTVAPDTSPRPALSVRPDHAG